MKRLSRAAGRRRLLNAWLWGATVLALPFSASASLGGDVSSVQVDQALMRGSRQVETALFYTLHEIRLPGGTRVREYVSPGGTVFGISWEGAFRPDLRQLLGAYFDEFLEAARAANRKRGGRGPVKIVRPGLVVHMGGHPRAFFGRAFVPGLLPPGFSADNIK